MNPYSPHEALCSEVEQKLSAFVDSELPQLERLGIELHLESCVACRREFELLTEASSFLREEGRNVPSPPAWESVRNSLTASREPRLTWNRWTGFERAIAASIGLFVLAGLLFAVARVERPKRTERATGAFGDTRVQMAGLPGLERFLTDHRAEKVTASDLSERVGFSPQVPDELPGGFRLQTAYVVRDRCCTGSCLIYRKGDELVTLVQHPPFHPVSWSSSALEDCTIAGFACRRNRGREVEILQIEPEKRNLTVVARTGAIDQAVFVRALSDGE